MPVIRAATVEDCKAMAPRMRADDALEMWRQGGWMPEDGLLFSVEQSEESYAVFTDDDDQIPCLIFGVSKRNSFFDDKRSIWMLGTDKAATIRRYVIETSKSYFQLMTAGKTVYNYVSPDNKQSLLWLRWMGFDIFDAEPHGWLKKPFHYVEKRVALCAPLQQQH